MSVEFDVAEFERRHPQIRVELRDGTNTWIFVVPINGVSAYHAQLAAGQALAGFVALLERDRDVVGRHLRACREAA